MANNTPILLEKYRKNIVPFLMKECSFGNIMEVPKIEKVVFNVGLGKALKNSKLIDAALNDVALITGQKPVVTKAKKSEANFKLRKGQSIGVKVTLRNRNMYDFLHRLISLSLPRVRDFEGLSKKSFDGKGNYTFGIKEHLIFHEIDYDKVVEVMGADITIVTSAKNNDDSFRLLKAFGLPFKN